MTQADTHGFEVRPLQAKDAGLIAEFMKEQPADHARFFYAFGADKDAIEKALSSCVRDVYFAMLWRGAILSVAMLRGWDAGYDIPSFGLIVDRKVKRTGVMQVLLDIAKVICRQSGTKTLMVKVHPDNISVSGIEHLGFKQVGLEASSGNVIYHMDF